jgi:uncharacterized protein (DUF952 family)
MIYHIETEDLWQQALPSGTYSPASYENNGFIHCASLEQITDVADSHYHGRRSSVLAAIP